MTYGSAKGFVNTPIPYTCPVTFSVNSPSASKSIQLPADPREWTSEQCIQYDRLEALAKSCGVKVLVTH
jgi:hypothetical protein